MYPGRNALISSNYYSYKLDYIGKEISSSPTFDLRMGKNPAPMIFEKPAIPAKIEREIAVEIVKPVKRKFKIK